MISRYEVLLNGTALSSLSPNILITDIKYTAPSMSYETYNVAKRHGARIWQRVVDQAGVTISFAIREYSIHNRQAVCNAVINWAKDGGVLQCNDRFGQRLRCVCTTFPYIANALQWTDELSITFTAYALPFWEDTIQTSTEITSTGSWEQKTVYVPGNIESALVEVEVLANASITTLNFQVGDYELDLTSISVSSGNKVNIKYDDNMIQSIKSGNTSLLNKRSGSTDLLAACGKNSVFKFKSNASAKATFKVRGLWL